MKGMIYDRVANTASKGNIRDIIIFLLTINQAGIQAYIASKHLYKRKRYGPYGRKNANGQIIEVLLCT